MGDFLVKLYGLPDFTGCCEALVCAGITVRRALSSEKHQVVDWLADNFGDGWASECEVAFGGHPTSCFIATQSGSIVGFACYDATLKGFFGPMGVDEGARGQGIGRALLLRTLHAMGCAGYGYAVIGGVEDAKFYRKVLGEAVMEIPGSSPGVYRDRLA